MSLFLIACKDAFAVELDPSQVAAVLYNHRTHVIKLYLKSGTELPLYLDSESYQEIKETLQKELAYEHQI